MVRPSLTNVQDLREGQFCTVAKYLFSIVHNFKLQSWNVYGDSLIIATLILLKFPHPPTSDVPGVVIAGITCQKLAIVCFTLELQHLRT